ncbi:putative nucleotidyltransferase substrate binding domain-containing protein [Bowmanella sp. JS7-9]|uniref:Nucleotidyltransferase substrate binding domain-containing protein n=1 Tax=Pseudobowmanella zhangzhouensis TaxID=1537679 RepID=A0ABW1XMC5_9ALTE|nr:putative nucleotidyltransferase substrate binding domain-containing protein [Bowmanella sp. JS7-9]TBX23850.1 nucleotidyltransferase [Bowmanella sp. JS7-9]
MTDIESNPELLMVVDFLVTCPPFDLLEDAQLHQLASSIEVQYYRKGHICGQSGLGGLRIIRSGAIDIRSQDDRLVQRMGEGESYNLASLLEEYPDAVVKLYEDSLLYTVPDDVFREIASHNRDFDRYYHRQINRRLRRAARYTPEPHNMMRTVESVMARDILSFGPETPIRHAAQAMSARRISSAPVLENDRLVGIITDRDFRSRVIAAGLDYNEPVSQVMTCDPISVNKEQTLFDATLLMVKRKIHHLPVVEKHDKGHLVGIITSSDLMLARQDDPVYVVQHIGRANDIQAMKTVVDGMPGMMVEWLNAGIKVSQVSHFLTAISDAVTRRLIEMYQDKQGRAPVAFCWLGFGSQGRAEQLVNADQDNGMVIADEASDEQLAWFKDMAKFVCDGLNECGYVYCPGQVMAMTDEWRQPLKNWRNTVNKWTLSPTPAAVMRVSIFFDLRAVYGDESLCKALQAHMLEQASSNSIFLAALAANVLEQSPPLGIFRRFIVERNGEHKDNLDLKKRGVIPIIDMMRIHSLANKIAAVNTTERIEALVQAKVLTVKDSRNMQDAYDFIMQTRARAQAAAIEKQGVEAVSNYIDPDTLPDTQRRHLKDAFTVVHDAQSAIRLRYRGGM